MSQSGLSLGQVVFGSFAAMRTTFANFFKGSNTVRYPMQQRPIPKQWRGGTFALTYDPNTKEENCIGCRLCEYICPSQIISVSLKKGEKRENGGKGTYADKFTLDYQACMQCELCVQVCPTDAIVMTRYLADCPSTREGLFLSKEKLFEHGKKLLERPEDESYATSSRLREWSDMKRGVPEPPAEPEAPKGDA